MSMIPAGSTPWKVVGAVDRTQTDPRTGQPATGKLVTFALSTGQQGTVFVPLAEATPDGVVARVQPEADNLAAILNLKSGM